MQCLSIVSVETPDIASPIRRWEEAVSKCVGRTPESLFEREENRCEALDRTPFSGLIEYGDLGDLSVSRMHTTANRFSRTLSSKADDPRLRLLMILQQRGHSILEQGGRHTTLQTGDWSLVDSRRPFIWTSPSASELIVVSPPRPADIDLTEIIGRSVARRVNGSSGAARVMGTMLMEALNQWGSLEVHGARSVGKAITSLLWGTLRDGRFDSEALPSVRNTLFTRLKVYIEDQLSDPLLSVESIAQRFQISTRSVHRAFAEGSSGSVTDFIWRCRVAQCALALRDPDQRQRSITDIALDWGFANSSHFSRAFRQGMGTSPRDYRVRHGRATISRVGG